VFQLGGLLVLLDQAVEHAAGPARRLFELDTEPVALSIGRLSTAPSVDLPRLYARHEVGLTDSGHELYLARDPDGTIRSAIELDLPARRAGLYQASGPAVLGAPLDRFLFARLLAEEGRVIVHAAGIVIEGRAVLCGAVSGGGKTTLSRVAAAAGLSILSDERVVVGANEGGAPTLWGTPWYGEGGFAAPGPAPLARILFLAKAEENRLLPLSPASAAARLLSLCTLPYWSREATSLAVSGTAGLLEHVPAAELRCRGDGSSVDFLVDLLRT
jgi:hypothetical protein